ncbi:MAG: type II toxin-antitoxin system VapC family toxin [Burkholderiaceae bacterium]|nr:type II toxin-antitoxin system VapC family toxin [Burkholderiaceae bacterium]MDH3460712.1 type II toxin-antitoxin system VapC family toxin [Burkholderiaceae bacterium]
MIGLDTDVLARYDVDDKTDAEAERQRAAAQRLIESGQPLMVCKTVILEFEWLMRGYCGFAQAQTATVLQHLLGLSHVTVEDRSTLEQALSHCDAGIDFADAPHHASYRAYASMVSFDDRKFARKAGRLGLVPKVAVPA